MSGRRIDSKYVKWLFFFYLLLVIKVIVFKYPMEQMKTIAASWEKGVILEGLHHANFTLFKTIRMYIDYAYKLNSFENLVGNVVVFIPFGLLLPCVTERGRKFGVMFLNAFLFVTGIEVFQLFSAFGAFDIDDILLNCMGAVCGYLIYVLCNRIYDIRKPKSSIASGRKTVENRQKPAEK